MSRLREEEPLLTAELCDGFAFQRYGCGAVVAGLRDLMQ